MKKKYFKIISIVLMSIFILMCIGNIVLGAEGNVANTLVDASEDVSLKESITVFDIFSTAIDGLVGILTSVIRIPLLLIIMFLQGLLTGIVSLGGSDIEGLLTPDDIFFNRVGLTNIDFFDFTGNVSAIQTIRINVATWYYTFRILAIVILLVVLIYIGIRMALSTVASEQAQYKRMLTDWLVSFALVFLLNYIIMFTIEANNALIALLEKPVRTKIGSGITTELAKRAAVGVATTSWGSLIVYAMFVGMTTAFLFSYIKRMLTVGFLIIISPLITITYSIDKVKDNKAQALNTWLKEFMFTVLIQPFHCIIYIVFASTAVDLLTWEGSLAKMVLAIICMAFTWKAEKIVKEIFGFRSASSLPETIASMEAVKAIGKAVSSAGSTGAKAVGKTSFGKNISAKASNTRIGQKITQTRNNFQTNHPKAASAVGKTKSVAGNIIKAGVPIGVAAVATGFEAGLNTSANAAHVGAEAYSATKKFMLGNPSAPGSKQNIQKNEEGLKRYADLISKNNTFNFDNYSTNQTNKDNLKAYAQTLIGTNMDMLNASIQDALKDLRNSNPTMYNPNTAAGMQHLNELQDMALDENLDFNDASTNPAGHAWTTEEKNVVTAIQIRNLAQAVQDTHSQYQAAGKNNPSQDIDNYIQNL